MIETAIAGLKQLEEITHQLDKSLCRIIGYLEYESEKKRKQKQI